MPKWAYKGCGQLTRRAFECQGGLVRGACGQLTRMSEKGAGRAFECQDGPVRCRQLTRRAFERQNGLVRDAGSLPAGPFSAKMGL